VAPLGPGRVAVIDSGVDLGHPDLQRRKGAEHDPLSAPLVAAVHSKLLEPRLEQLGERRHRVDRGEDADHVPVVDHHR